MRWHRYRYVTVNRFDVYSKNSSGVFTVGLLDADYTFIAEGPQPPAKSSTPRSRFRRAQSSSIPTAAVAAAVVVWFGTPASC